MEAAGGWLGGLECLCRPELVGTDDRGYQCCPLFPTLGTQVKGSLTCHFCPLTCNTLPL